MYTATPDNVLDIAAIFLDTEIIIVIKINVSYHRFKRFCTCRYLLKKIYMEHFCWRRPFVVCVADDTDSTLSISLNTQ